MRALTAAAALVLASASLATAVGQTTVSDAAASATASAKKTAATKACTSAADALVWFVPGTKLFYRKGQTGFGKGVGSLVCRHIALGKHGHPAPTSTPSAEPVQPSTMPTADPSAAPMTSAQPMASAAPTMQP